MMALKLFLLALSLRSSTVVVAQEISQLVPPVLEPSGIYVEAAAPTPRRLSVAMDTNVLRGAMAAWCDDPTAAEEAHGHISAWDVSAVMDLSSLIYSHCGSSESVINRNTFNEDISAWDVSSVTTMNYMFYGASAFNQPLSEWDVSAVTSMAGVFRAASSFNQPLSGWDVSSVTSMYAMFQGAGAFDQPLSGWDVSSVTTMYAMFWQASAFNQVLCWGVTEANSGVNVNYMFDDSSPASAGPCSGNAGSCFHASGAAMLESGASRKMSELGLGDVVQVADEEGKLSFSQILLLPHKKNDELATFLNLTTESGKTTLMTADHLIPRCGETITLSMASELSVGDCLLTADGKETLTEIVSVVANGVYTAVTKAKFILVDGIVASPFSRDSDRDHSTREYEVLRKSLEIKQKLELGKAERKHQSIAAKQLDTGK